MNILLRLVVAILLMPAVLVPCAALAVAVVERRLRSAAEFLEDFGPFAVRGAGAAGVITYGSILLLR